MEMTLRWYGSEFDTVTLKQIRQIPGVTGVITTLYDTAPGEVWSRERIKEMKDEVEKSGLHVSGIESVNVHDAIKVGTSDRDKYIDNYIETLENLGKEDIHLVCYNFMPVFDWTRSELARKRPDGSTVLAYNQDDIDKKRSSLWQIEAVEAESLNSFGRCLKRKLGTRNQHEDSQSQQRSRRENIAHAEIVVNKTCHQGSYGY